MKNELLEKLTRLANECDDAEVRAWIGRHLAETIREDRPKRKRGIRVRLGRINRDVVIDEDVVRRAERKE